MNVLPGFLGFYSTILKEQFLNSCFELPNIGFGLLIVLRGEH